MNTSMNKYHAQSWTFSIYAHENNCTRLIITLNVDRGNYSMEFKYKFSIYY